MAQVLLVDDDPDTRRVVGTVLRMAGYQVIEVSSGSEALECLARRAIDVIIAELRLPDMPGLDLFRSPRWGRNVPFVIITGFGTVRDAVSAMRLGAHDVVDKPVLSDDVLRIVRRALARPDDASAPDAVVGEHQVAHAAARWAQALVPIIECPQDPRTVSRWARWVAASPGAIRTWCHTAGIGPRRSLLFGRMLRAVARSDGGRLSLENLLDIVDRRTLYGNLRLAGLSGTQHFPRDIDEFLRRQMLIREPEALREVKRAVEERQKGTVRAPKAAGQR